MADQDLKILKDTQELVRLYNKDIDFKRRVDELISYPGATYKNRPLRLYSLVITRFAPQYKEYERSTKQNPSKIGELFDRFYREGPFNRFEGAAGKANIFTPPELQQIRKIEELPQSNDQYQQYHQLLAKKDQEAEHQSIPNQPQVTETTPESAPAEAETTIPATASLEKPPPAPQMETYHVEPSPESTQPATTFSPIQAPNIAQSDLAKNFTSSLQINIKKFSSRYLSLDKIGNFLAEIGNTILGTKPNPAGQAVKPVVGQPTAINNLVTDAMVSAKKLISRYANPSVVASSFSGVLGAVVGGGITGSGEGALVGGVIGAATPIVIQHGGGELFMKGGGGVIDGASRLFSGLSSAQAKASLLRTGGKALLATPVGRIALIVAAVVIFLFVIYFAVDLPKSSAPLTPYPLTEVGPEIPGPSQTPPSPIPFPSPPAPGGEYSCPIPGGYVSCGSYWTPKNGCGHCNPSGSNPYPPSSIAAYCKPGWGTESAIDIAGAPGTPIILPTIGGHVIRWTYYGQTARATQAIQVYFGTDDQTGQQYYLQLHHTLVGSGNQLAQWSGDQGASVCVIFDPTTGERCDHVHVQLGMAPGNFVDTAQYLCR